MPESDTTILVLTAGSNQREVITQLERQFTDFTLGTADASDEAVSVLRDLDIDCVIVGYTNEEVSPMTLYEKLRSTRPEMPIILLDETSDERTIQRVLEDPYAEVVNWNDNHHGLLSVRVAQALEW